MHAMAERLGAKAELRATPVRDGEVEFELVPAEPTAATVTVSVDLTDPDGELWVTVAGEGETGDLLWLRNVVDAAVAGNVTLLEGRGRRRLEIALGPDDVRSTTTYGRGFVPLPWRRHARITRFAAY